MLFTTQPTIPMNPLPECPYEQSAQLCDQLPCPIVSTPQLHTAKTVCPTLYCRNTATAETSVMLIYNRRVRKVVRVAGTGKMEVRTRSWWETDRLEDLGVGEG